MSNGVFGHGQLRLYLLVALQDGPASGYDIIRALQDRFAGLYSPSAGTVYPRLAKLEEEGLVRRHEQGRRATYELTDAGRAELGERTDDVSRLESDVDAAHRRLADEMRSRVASGSEQLRAELEAAARLARAAAGLSGVPRADANADPDGSAGPDGSERRDGAERAGGVERRDGSERAGRPEGATSADPAATGTGPAVSPGAAESAGASADSDTPGRGAKDPFRAGTDWSDAVRWFTHTARAFESRGRASGAGSTAGAPGASSRAGDGDRPRTSSPEQWLRVVEIMRDAGQRIQEVLADEGNGGTEGNGGRAGGR